MKLSRTVSYAVRAALQLARRESPSPVPCNQLATEGKMPERFLLQVLRNLVNHGILRSTRGVEGGYVLDRSLDEVSLLDVIEAIDGPMDSNTKIAEGFSANTQQKLLQAFQDVTATTRSQLEAIKLAHLIEPPAKE